MNFLHASFLAIIQGITEFLPISSSAHLVFLPKLFGWTDQGLIFDIAVHFGTLLAVLIYFKADLIRIIKGSFLQGLKGQKSTELMAVVNLAIATVPLVICALLFSDALDNINRLVPVLATSSIVFGLLLWWADKKRKADSSEKSAWDVSLKDAFIFGIFQAMALIPGTSRSGICVTAGRFLGYSRSESGRFATWMAVPTILLATVYSLMKTELGAINWQHDSGILLLSILISMVTALFGIHLLVSWLARVGYVPFVLYRLVLGIGLWVWFLI